MVGYRCSWDFLSQKLCLANVQTVIWFPPKVLETITWFYFNRFSCHFNVNLESKTKNAMELLVLVSNALTANHFILNKFTGYMISFHSAWHIRFRDSQVLLILSPSLVCDWEWQALLLHSAKATLQKTLIGTQAFSCATVTRGLAHTRMADLRDASVGRGPWCQTWAPAFNIRIDTV